MINTHEESVNHNAQSDEEVHKTIHNEDFYEVRKLVPTRRTLPTEEQLYDFRPKDLFPGEALVADEACKTTNTNSFTHLYITN